MISNLSSRVKTRRYDSMRRKKLFASFRHLSSVLSYVHGFQRFDFGGTIGPCQAIRPELVFLPPSWPATRTVGVALPTHMALSTNIAHCIINPYYHGIITRSANRVTLITVATATSITGFLIPFRPCGWSGWSGDVHMYFP